MKREWEIGKREISLDCRLALRQVHFMTKVHMEVDVYKVALAVDPLKGFISPQRYTHTSLRVSVSH